MSGPVWRFEARRTGRCGRCLRDVTGLFVEGQIADNAMQTVRELCAACFADGAQLVVNGEAGEHIPSPAYAR